MPYSLRMRTKSMNPHEFRVDSLKEASEKARGFILERDLTMHNFESTLFDPSGKVVGHVSYNGRVWPGEASEWRSSLEPLYDPRKRPVSGRKDAGYPHKRFLVEVERKLDGSLYANGTRLYVPDGDTVLFDLYGIDVGSIKPGLAFTYRIEAALFAMVLAQDGSLVKYDPVIDWGDIDDAAEPVIFFGPDPIPVSIAHEVEPDIDMPWLNKTLGEFGVVSVSLVRDNGGKWTASVQTEDHRLGDGEGTGPGSALLSAVCDAREGGG